MVALGWNDMVSSVLIPADMSVRLYEHDFYNGRSILLTQSVDCLASYGFDNMMTSYTVTAGEPRAALRALGAGRGARERVERQMLSPVRSHVRGSPIPILFQRTCPGCRMQAHRRSPLTCAPPSIPLQNPCSWSPPLSAPATAKVGWVGQVP